MMDSARRSFAKSDTALLRAPIAALALVVLTVRWASKVLTNVVERRSGLAWVSTALARQSLKNTDDAPTQPLPTTLQERIARFNPADVSTDAEAALLGKAFEDWKRERRRGMVAVTGSVAQARVACSGAFPEPGRHRRRRPAHSSCTPRSRHLRPGGCPRLAGRGLSGQTDGARDSATAIALLDQLPPPCS